MPKPTDHPNWVFTHALHAKGFVLCLLSVDGLQTIAHACAPGDEHGALVHMLKKAGVQ